ncbi:hypothetical protein CR159_19755 [Pollutimonas subterranea]|uniref:Dolichyl-phosphate-mannose-protein mannosyltransferase n=1 Tax=Pollutimonas subterranea TaxID=2045210 RepID=A0A2N4TZG4_9BURK|nr:hypothetical protein [Pollutimonas subterranea]PLC48158.1 hypothetical protein CR159_19755 [Pollutimonas subterranea]
MVFDLIRVHAAASLFLLHCAVLGFALFKPMGLWTSSPAPDSNRYLKWFFAISLGCLANIAALFVLGLIGWFSGIAVLITGLVLVMAALPIAMKQARVLHLFHITSRSAAVLDVLMVLVLLFTAMIVAFHPPGHWDDTMYQLPLARDTLQHQGFVLNEYLRFPLFPQNINLLLALGLMLGGDLMAQTFASIPLFIMALGSIGASVWIMGTPLPGAIASVLLFTLGPIKPSLGYAYIDNGLALFCWGATLAFALWLSQDRGKRSYGWLIAAGLLAGAAAGSKYFGGAFAFLLGVCVVLARRDGKASVVYGLAVLLTGSWWYLRSFVNSGDPVHPAGGNYFGFFLWNADDLLRQKAEQATHGVSLNPLYLWSTLKEANVIVWMLAFIGLVLPRTPAPVRALQFVFLAYFVFWFFVTQVTRYLAPISAVGTLLSFYTLYRCVGLLPLAANNKLALNRRGAIASYIVLAMMVIFAANRYDKYHKETVQWDAILSQKPGYTLFKKANTLIPEYGDRLVQLGFENAVYYFDGVVIGDWFGPGRYSSMLDCNAQRCTPVEAEAMKQQLEKFGSRMLVVSTQQYPDFNPAAYAHYFDVVLQADDGVLLILR